MTTVEISDEDMAKVDQLITTLQAIGLILLRSSHKDLFSSIEWEQLEGALTW